MPFIKKRRNEEEEEVPREREERTRRIVDEVRTDYDDEQEEYEEPAKPVPSKGLNVTITIDEMRADYNAHATVVATTNDAFLRTGIPPHLVQGMVQGVCGEHIARMNDLGEVLQKHERRQQRA